MLLHPHSLTEPKGQLLLIDGKTEDEVRRSLERVLLTMRITTSEPKVPRLLMAYIIYNTFKFPYFFCNIREVADILWENLNPEFVIS